MTVTLSAKPPAAAEVKPPPEDLELVKRAQGGDMAAYD